MSSSPGKSGPRGPNPFANTPIRIPSDHPSTEVPTTTNKSTPFPKDRDSPNRSPPRTRAAPIPTPDSSTAIAPTSISTARLQELKRAEEEIKRDAARARANEAARAEAQQKEAGGPAGSSSGTEKKKGSKVGKFLQKRTKEMLKEGTENPGFWRTHA